jgi:hypothetical protein
MHFHINHPVPGRGRTTSIARFSSTRYHPKINGRWCLADTGVGAVTSDGFIETFVEFPNGLIRHPQLLDAEGEYVGEEFVPLARPFELKGRLLGGSIVFFGKTSIYNQSPSTYDARHQKLGRERFYRHIKQQLGSAKS